MLPLSRILFPVDLSDRSLAMLPFAETVARKFNAELILLYVVSPPYMVAAGYQIPVPVSEETMAEEGAKLEKFGANQLPDVRVRRVLREGDPAQQIVGFLRSEGIDLVAMPTHGGRFRRFLIGSVTAKVLHDASCPVLTGVHKKEHAATDVSTHADVLCAIDLGPQSADVLKFASQLAADFQARLSVMHAVPLPTPGSEFLFTRDWKAEAANLARMNVENLLRASGGAANVYVREGDPENAVCSLAKDLGTDLLVIGRGPQDEYDGRLTTHAYGIIRQSPCPVVSI